ncbi:hypothetical protein [Streptomyces sp. NPDC002521]
MVPSLRSAYAVVSPPRKPYAEDPAVLSFYRDLLKPFDREVDEELLRAAPHVDHCELVDRLVAAADLGGAAPDLVIIAQALPDITPFVAIGPYLDHRLGGRATTFGIHQQGLAAPFTALRAVSAFHRAGRSRLAVVAVLEQTTLPTRFPLVHDNQLVDSGALLVFGEGAGFRVGEVVAIPAGTPPAGRIAEVLAKEPDSTLLVTGPWADPDELGGPVRHHHRTGSGSYCTSVWLDLARNWPSWQREYTAVVLCDTDPRTGDSQLAVLRSEAGSGVRR